MRLYGRAAAAALLLLGSFTGCTADRPQRMTAGAEATEAERRMRKEADDLETALRNSELAFRDEKLEAYLSTIADRLLVAQGASGQKVRVLVGRDALVNAVALPNGLIYIHTGLLAMLENEAQLADVLGHEIEHYLGRHPLRRLLAYEHESNKRKYALAASVFLGVMVGSSAIVASTPYVTSSIALDGYDRDIERDADAAGVRVMAAAGYDASQAPRAFELLRQEEDEGDVKEPYYYADHPALTERIQNSSRQVAELRAAGWTPDGKVIGKGEYEAAIVDVLLVNAQLNQNLRRFGRARHAIDRYVSIRPNDARGYYERGRLARRESSSKRAGIEASVASFRRAAELDPKHADSLRELGLALRDLGKSSESRPYLARYLQLAPAANDRAIIESYMR